MFAIAEVACVLLDFVMFFKNSSRLKIAVATQLERGLIDHNAGGRVFGCRADLRRVASGLLDFACGGLHFLHGVGLPRAHAAEHPRQFARHFWQLVDYGP